MPTTPIKVPEITNIIDNSVQHQQINFIHSINDYKRMLTKVQQAIHGTSVIANHRAKDGTPLSQSAIECSQQAVRLVLVSLENQQTSLISIIKAMELTNALLDDVAETDFINECSSHAGNSAINQLMNQSSIN